MKRTMELCGTCKASYSRVYDLTPVIVGKDRKVTCEGCNRRRYSSRYELRRKREERSA